MRYNVIEKLHYLSGALVAWCNALLNVLLPGSSSVTHRRGASKDWISLVILYMIINHKIIFICLNKWFYVGKAKSACYFLRILCAFVV